MTQEYEQKKRECWEEFKNEVFNGNISYSPYGGFDFAFDRAYALGKQEKDADAVIQGWVCRDKEWDKDLFASDLYLSAEKPTRDEYCGVWCNMCAYMPLNTELFPDLTWDSDPEPVEIIIKRKKK